MHITLFTQRNIGGLFIPGRECPSCEPTQRLLEETAALSPKIQLEVVDFYGDQERAQSARVHRIPAIVISGDGKDNARMYGLPAGSEFPVLLDTIVTASTGRSGLQLETRRRLKRLQEDVHIQVFVTPTCQFCPAVARLAHQMAQESPRVVAEVVEIQTFPRLAQVYNVMGVPKTVINDSVEIVGAVSEDVLLKGVLRATGEEEADMEPDETVSDQTTPVA